MKTAPLYIVLDETSIDGTYSTPEDAVKDTFRYDLKKFGLITYGDEQLTVKEMAKRMLDPHSDYPVIIKLEAGKSFRMDR
jgi:hypothetical protein